MGRRPRGFCLRSARGDNKGGGCRRVGEPAGRTGSRGEGGPSPRRQQPPNFLPGRDGESPRRAEAEPEIVPRRRRPSSTSGARHRTARRRLSRPPPSRTLKGRAPAARSRAHLRTANAAPAAAPSCPPSLPRSLLSKLSPASSAQPLPRGRQPQPAVSPALPQRAWRRPSPTWVLPPPGGEGEKQEADAGGPAQCGPARRSLRWAGRTAPPRRAAPGEASLGLGWAGSEAAVGTAWLYRSRGAPRWERGG